MQSLHTAGEPQNTTQIVLSRISLERSWRQLEGTELAGRSLVNWMHLLWNKTHCFQLWHTTGLWLRTLMGSGEVIQYQGTGGTNHVQWLIFSPTSSCSLTMPRVTGDQPLLCTLLRPVGEGPAAWCGPHQGSPSQTLKNLSSQLNYTCLNSSCSPLQRRQQGWL